MTEAAAYPAIYRGVRERIAGLVADADPHTSVPATPQWDVHDLLAHITGDAADLLAFNIEGVGTEPWTAAQVAARKDATIADLLAEWDDAGSRLEEIMPNLPRAGIGQLVFDMATHEHDLRQALGDPGARDSDAVVASVGWVAKLGPKVTLDRSEAVTIEWPDGSTQFGPGEPDARVTMPSGFEMLRAISGRRSREQLAAYDWDGSVTPETLLMASFFRIRDTPLDE